MNDWKGFYESRINSSYQTYFEQRYKKFLDFIKEENNTHIIELGCGIGSVSKALIKERYTCKGFDLCDDMVRLANTNVDSDIFYKGDIFEEHVPVDIIGVSHGVLEHFNDEQILEIIKKHKYSIHYVPLDKYKTPSFGDERLLPPEYWLELVKPSEAILFNNGYDLCFRT